MAGGLDILIVGIAGEELYRVASDEKLEELFDDRTDDADFARDFLALNGDPNLANPRILYLKGERMFGSQIGAGLGYVIFDGNDRTEPRKLDEQVFGRIDELKKRFVTEVEAKGLKIPPEQVGVYALHIYDTDT